MAGFGRLSRRHFLTTATIVSGSALLPKPLIGLSFGDTVQTSPLQQKEAANREKVAWKVRPFPIKQVQLGEGPCKAAMEADRQYLRSLPAERLLHAFRVNAGISSSAQPLGGWEAPDCELRGHYAGGHYLSACALMYAACGDEDLKNNANKLVAELGKWQAVLKNGYLSAFPIEFFDRLRERQKVAPPRVRDALTYPRGAIGIG